MAKTNYDDSDGVWRTINGRKVFIREGQSLASAMRESGKFKKTFRKLDKRNEKEEKLAKQRQTIEDIKNYSKADTSLKTLNNLGVFKEDYKDDRNTSLKEKINKLKQKYLNEKEHKNYTKELRAKYTGSEKSTKIKDTDWKGVYRSELADPATYKHEKEVKNTEYGKLVNKYNDIDDKMVKYNTERNNIYPGYDKENAEKELSAKDYKKFVALTEKYENERRKLRDVADEYEDYRKSHSNREILKMQSDEKTGSSTINNRIRQEAYKKYLKEHPNSKMSFAEFKDMNKY